MWEKIKSCYNKKYAVICGYVIATGVIIFGLAYVVTQINSIFSWINGFVGYFMQLITPVLIGVIIAYLLDPLAEWMEKYLQSRKFINFKNKKWYRSLSVLITFLLVIIFIFGFLSVFVYSITKQLSNSGLNNIIDIAASYIRGFTQSIENVDDLLASLNIESSVITQYIDKLSRALVTGLSTLADALVSSTMSFSSHITDGIFGIIIAIYLLLDKVSFIGYGNTLARAMFKDTTTVKIKGYFKDFDNIFSGYIRGQMADVIFMCIALSVILSLVGIKFSVLIGCFAGICNVIPYFGPIVAYVGTISFGLLNGQFKQVIIAVIFLAILQQIDGNIIGPKLMGRNIELKPIFILIAVTTGGAAFGLIGMVLAVPVAGLIRLILVRCIDKKLDEKNKLLDIDIETNQEVSD